MDIGIGLPTTFHGIAGQDILDWARRGEQVGFSSLGTLDRLVYDNYEPLITLAAAAGATSRIGLVTTILIAPYRGDKALLAKQLASLHGLSGGRLSVGVAAGGRPDDFEAGGTSFTTRGRRLDELLGELRGQWDGGSTGLVPGPRLPEGGGPPLLIGGHSPAALRRAAAYGDGWIAGGSSASNYGELVSRVRDTWRAAGRSTGPRLVAIAYAALGPGTRDRAESYVLDYYSFMGWKAEMTAKSVLFDAGQLREFAAGYAEAGCDELILYPCVPEVSQVDLIADAVLGAPL